MATFEEKLGCAGGLGVIAGSITVFAAWLTHVIVCIKAGAWLLLIAGALVFPIGIVHGIGQWFGIW